MAAIFKQITLLFSNLQFLLSMVRHAHKLNFIKISFFSIDLWVVILNTCRRVDGLPGMDSEVVLSKFGHLLYVVRSFNRGWGKFILQ